MLKSKVSIRNGCMLPQIFLAFLFKGYCWLNSISFKCQGENVTARLASVGASQFKTPHSESAKKKIDLPVQKNLLTKYFCILQSILELILIRLIRLASLKGRNAGRLQLPFF